MKISKKIMLEGIVDNMYSKEDDHIQISVNKKNNMVYASTDITESPLDPAPHKDTESENIVINKINDIGNFEADLMFNARDMDKWEKDAISKEEALKMYEKEIVLFRIDPELWKKYVQVYSVDK